MRCALIVVPLAFSCWPALAVETIKYNSKQDTIVDVIWKSGLSTKHAVIHAVFTRRDAAIQCSDDNNGSLKRNECINLELTAGSQLKTYIHANCLTKTFTDFLGERHRFAGRRKNTDPNDYVVGDDAKFSIIDENGQEETDGPTFYGTNLDLFRALCPKQGPPLSAGYFLYSNQWLRK